MSQSTLQLYDGRAEHPLINSADRIDAPIKLTSITIINAGVDTYGLQLGYEMTPVKSLEEFETKAKPIFSAAGTPDIIPIPNGIHTIPVSTVCDLPAVVLSAACLPMQEGATIDATILVNYATLPQIK